MRRVVAADHPGDRESAVREAVLTVDGDSLETSSDPEHAVARQDRIFVVAGYDAAGEVSHGCGHMRRRREVRCRR